MSALRKSNDKGVPRDELTLAKLIQAARARGLVGCTGDEFQDAEESSLDTAKGAYACCALGAYRLARLKPSHEEDTFGGNDHNDDQDVSDPEDFTAYSIGAAFSHAMRRES